MLIFSNMHYHYPKESAKRHLCVHVQVCYIFQVHTLNTHVFTQSCLQSRLPHPHTPFLTHAITPPKSHPHPHIHTHKLPPPPLFPPTPTHTHTCTCLPCINFKDSAHPAELPRWLSWYSICLERRTSRVRVLPEAALLFLWKKIVVFGCRCLHLPCLYN